MRLKIEGLSKSYKKKKALDSVNLFIQTESTVFGTQRCRKDNSDEDSCRAYSAG